MVASRPGPTTAGSEDVESLGGGHATVDSLTFRENLSFRIIFVLFWKRQLSEKKKPNKTKKERWTRHKIAKLPRPHAAVQPDQ
jgi:hypothetical protein